MGSACVSGDGTSKTETEKWDSNGAKGVLCSNGHGEDLLKRLREERRKSAKLRSWKQNEKNAAPSLSESEEQHQQQFIRLRSQSSVPSVTAISNEEPDVLEIAQEADRTKAVAVRVLKQANGVERREGRSMPLRKSNIF